MEWSYWQKVVIIVLSIVVVVLAYRRLLRWVGGNARFDHKFAYLFPLEKSPSGMLLVKFELPESDVVNLTIEDASGATVTVIVDNATLKNGVHQFEIDASALSDSEYSFILKSGNQKLERLVSGDRLK